MNASLEIRSRAAELESKQMRNVTGNINHKRHTILVRLIRQAIVTDGASITSLKFAIESGDYCYGDWNKCCHGDLKEAVAISGKRLLP